MLNSAQIFVNNEMLGLCAGSSSETINGMSKSLPTSLWLGCTSSGSTPDMSTSIMKALVAHPTLWYWPVQLHVLLLGNKGAHGH